MNLEENTGFAAYAIYNAIHLHFTSSSYNFQKYNGKTNVSKDSFLKRKDKYHFYKLSRKYSIEELKDFFIANFLDTSVKWVGDISGEEGEKSYLKWKKRKESLSYIFQNDIDFLLDQVKKPDHLLVVKSGNYPKLLEVTMQGRVEVETTCILNDMMNFLPMWNKKITDDIIWPDWRMKIDKYTPFIEYNKTKYKLLLTKKIKDHEET
jgi:hypothetical protein